MLRTVGKLVLISVFILTLPSVSSATDDHPKKYGVELQFGGGYYMLGDVNDYIPFDFIGLKDEPDDKINIGSQFGIGIIYRVEDNFGWQIGFNKLSAGVPGIFDQKYRIETQLSTSEGEDLDPSWVEQTVKGWELYALPTWYKSMGAGELMFAIGPTVTSASLDRSIDLVKDASGTHLSGGSFVDAKGKALGLTLALGYEMPLSANTGLSFQLGGRVAKIGFIRYPVVLVFLNEEETNRIGEDTTDEKVYEIVYINEAIGKRFALDMTGGFAKVTYRMYFTPSSKWRSY
ncbi:hypothetical protein HQ587_06485 [bacterium]|nr:hypothetical protein [bacterium]